MRPPSWTYAVFICVISSALTAVAVAGIAVRLSERKFCSLMVILDEGYSAPVSPGTPPLSERGQRIASAIADLRRSLHCG